MSFIKKTMDELLRADMQEAAAIARIPVIVVLDDIRSMHNVGSVFRTADAFVLEKIILCGFTPKPPHREIQKTALGATETVPWEAKDDIKEALTQLREAEYQIIGVEQTHNSTSLPEYNVDSQKKYAIVLGNEVEGVSDTALEQCHAVLEIPQSGTKHSLNISVAAGIALWHFYKEFP
jgi:23S rRNA (guanosine2251-2'-O)-methyltransferase